MLKWLAPLPGLLWFLIIYGSSDLLETSFQEPTVMLIIYLVLFALYYFSFTDLFQTLITLPHFSMGHLVTSSSDAEDACLVVLARLGILVAIYGLPIMLLMRSS